MSTRRFGNSSKYRWVWAFGPKDAFHKQRSVTLPLIKWNSAIHNY